MNSRIKKYQDRAGFFFVAAVAILAIVSILGVWDIFSVDVVTKSFQTFGLLALVTVIVVVSGRFVGTSLKNEISVPDQPNQAFLAIRRTTLGVLIISVVALALIGVLTIWEVISEQETLFKSLSSIGILVFCSFVIVLMCLERERSGSRGKNSIGTIILILIFLLLMTVLI